MKLQPKWLREAIREANDMWENQNNICNRILADKYSTFENHPQFDNWVRATILYERAVEHVKLMEHRWQSLTPSEQYEEARK